jgi:hypothetical protein
MTDPDTTTEASTERSNDTETTNEETTMSEAHELEAEYRNTIEQAAADYEDTDHNADESDVLTGLLEGKAVDADALRVHLEDVAFHVREWTASSAEMDLSTTIEECGADRVTLAERDGPIVIEAKQIAKAERAAKHAGEVDHFFETEGRRAVEKLADNETVPLIDVINELGEIALQVERDIDARDTDSWRLRELLNVHNVRGKSQEVRIEKRDPTEVAKELFPNVESDDSTDEESEEVQDLTHRRAPSDQETTTLKLTVNQVYTVTNALGEDALKERRADRMNNAEVRWGLRQAIKQAAGIANEDEVNMGADE